MPKNAKGYRFIEGPDGVLIRNVNYIRPIARGERGELRKAGLDLDGEFFAAAAAKYNAAAAKGRAFPVTLDHRGKRVGRIMGQRLTHRNGQPTFAMDLLLTDPDTIARWKRGELPEISADVDLEKREVYAASVLESGFGHLGFDDFGTQFVPEGMAVALSERGANINDVAVLELQAAAVIVEDPKQPPTTGSGQADDDPKQPDSTETEMTKEEIMAMLEELKTSLMASLDEKIEAALGIKAARTKADGAGPEAIDELTSQLYEKDKAHQLELAERDEQLKSELQRREDINDKVTEYLRLSDGRGVTPRVYRAQLDKCDSAQARDHYHALTLERVRSSRAPVSAMKPGAAAPSKMELELQKEFDADEEALKKCGFTQESYVKTRLSRKNQTNVTVAI